MQDPYRDQNESLRARNEALETEIAERRAELDALRREAATDRVVVELERLLDARDRRSRRRWLAGLGTLAAGSAAAVMFRREPGGVIAPRPIVVAPAPGAGIRPGGGLGGLGGFGAVSTEPFLRIVLGGATRVFSKTELGRLDGVVSLMAGMKYRRGGERSPWITVAETRAWDGPVRSGEARELPAFSLHAVGGFMPVADGGTTSVDLLSVSSWETRLRYQLVRGGPGVLESTLADGHLVGRLEATVRAIRDVDQVETGPDVSLSAWFRLPMQPLDPSDVAP